MASRKEEKERLRLEREQAEKREQAAGRKRLMLGYAVAAVLGLAVVIGIVVAVTGGGSDGGDSTTVSSVEGEESDNVDTTYGVLPEGLEVDTREGTPPPEVVNGDLVTASEEAGCDLQENLEDEGSTHVSGADKLPEYGTQPPTSGDHYPDPLADGAFTSTPDPGNYIHSLEHGRIEIQYSPDLPEEDQLALKGLFDADRAGIIMFPNADMEYDVATTGWTQLMGCPSYDGQTTLDAVRAFIQTYRGQGPENIPF